MNRSLTMTGSQFANLGVRGRAKSGYRSGALALRNCRGTGLALRWFGLFLLVSACVGGAAPRIENLEQIKNFLTGRPSVEFFVVASTNNASFAFAQYLPTKGAGDPNPAMYQGARQDDNFYLRRVMDRTDENARLGTNSLFLSGWSDGLAWHAGSFFAAKTTSSDDERTAFPYYRGTNYILQFVSTSAQLLHRFLDLGLIDIKRGTFQFNGNRFRVALNRGGEAEGELMVDNGVVSSIRFQIVGHNKHVVSEFEYNRVVGVPNYLPSRVIQKAYDDEGQFSRITMDFAFLSLKLADHGLAASHFLPDRFYNPVQEPNATIEILSRNDVLYRYDGTKLVALSTAGTGKKPGAGRAFFLSILIALTSVPLFIFFRTVIRNRKQNHTT